MKVLLMILGGCVVGLIIGLIDLNGQKPVRKYKKYKPKSDWSLRSYWKSLDDYDMNYGSLSMEKRKKRKR